MRIGKKKSPLKHKTADPQHDVTYGEGHDNSAHPDHVEEGEHQYAWSRGNVRNRNKGVFLANFKKGRKDDIQMGVKVEGEEDAPISSLEKRIKKIEENLKKPYTIEYKPGDKLRVGFNSPGSNLVLEKHDILKLEYAFQDWINKEEGKDVTGGRGWGRKSAKLWNKHKLRFFASDEFKNLQFGHGSHSAKKYLTHKNYSEYPSQSNKRDVLNAFKNDRRVSFDFDGNEVTSGFVDPYVLYETYFKELKDAIETRSGGLDEMKDHFEQIIIDGIIDGKIIFKMNSKFFTNLQRRYFRSV